MILPEEHRSPHQILVIAPPNSITSEMVATELPHVRETCANQRRQGGVMKRTDPSEVIVVGHEALNLTYGG